MRNDTRIPIVRASWLKHQRAAQLRRRRLPDGQRDGLGCGATGETDDEAHRHEHAERWGEGSRGRPDDEHHGGAEQRRTPADGVRDQSRSEGPDQQKGGDERLVEGADRTEGAVEEQQRSRHAAGVVAEQQSAEGGDRRHHEQVTERRCGGVLTRFAAVPHAPERSCSGGRNPSHSPDLHFLRAREENRTPDLRITSGRFSVAPALAHSLLIAFWLLTGGIGRCP